MLVLNVPPALELLPTIRLAYTGVPGASDVAEPRLIVADVPPGRVILVVFPEGLAMRLTSNEAEEMVPGAAEVPALHRA
jgi:hypothetical protein